MATLHVQCLNCGAFELTSDHGDPDGALDGKCFCCPHGHAGSGCRESANACKGHPGEPCPYPPLECPVFGGGHTAPTGNPADPSGYMVKGQCPGGHCGKGVAGCGKCRPVAITALKGSFGTLRPFSEVSGGS